MKWLQYRRRRWFVGFAATMIFILGAKLLSPPTVELVIYNEGVSFLGPLQITIGDRNITLPGLASGESQVRELDHSYRGELVVWLHDDPPIETIGPWIDGEELTQVVVRVDALDNVMFSSTPTWQVRLQTWLP